MNVFTRIKAAKNALFSKIVEASLPAGTVEWMKRWGKDPDISQEALVRKYWGWTYSCVSISASKFASVPLKVYASRAKGQSKVGNFSAKAVSREQSKWLRSRLTKSLPQVAGAEDFEELEEHPLLELLQKVNDQENSFEMKELTSAMLDLTGDAYWLTERDKLGVPSKLFVLRSQWTRILPDKQKFISGYLYGCNGQWTINDRLELAPEEVIHFKYPNPRDPWYGFGPVQAAGFTIEADELRQRFMIATLTNMGRPDLIVRYMEGELDPTERMLLDREWNATFRGAKNAGKVKVTDFRYEIEKVGWNPNELDFNRGEADILKRICSAFPVPVALLDTSLISRAPRAGMEGGDLFMSQFNTLPRCTRIEEKLNEQLCPMYDERLFVAFDNPVPKDRQAQLNEDTAKLNTYRTTVNELRKRDGEEEVEWGNLPLTSPGIAPLGSTQQALEQEPGAGNNQPIPQATGTRGAGGLPGGASLFGKKKPEDQLPIEQAAADAAKKALDNGMTIEVDGQYVSPQLAGIPLRLKPSRNEGGRFHRAGPDQVRAGGDDVDGLKRNLRLKEATR